MLFAPAPHAPRVAADRVDPLYRQLRWQVFAGIFIGYSGYYLVRKNFSLAVPYLVEQGFSKGDLGFAMSGVAIAYGFSKFLMGAVSDRSNPRFFLPVGLLLSAGLTLVMGLVPAALSSITAMFALQLANGWVQGMGWPPSGRTMVHWWSQQERGTVVSAWNIAHNVGGGLIGPLFLLGMHLFGDWRSAFYVPAAVAIAVALFALATMRDTPQSCGLPPVEEWRNDYPPGYGKDHERTLSFREIFLTHVFGNRLLWAIAIANAFVYFVRYGVVDWVPAYLQTAKGFSFQESSWAWSAFEWAGVPGTILCGWVSDRWFRSRRAPATVLFMIPTLLGLVVYGLNRNGPLAVDVAALIVIGFFIYGPIMLIGLQALDMVPKKAAGTAAGFTGFFGYVFGSAFAGTGVGWIADHWGWTGVVVVMCVCCVLTMAFSALTLSHGARSESR